MVILLFVYMLGFPFVIAIVWDPISGSCEATGHSLQQYVWFFSELVQPHLLWLNRHNYDQLKLLHQNLYTLMKSWIMSSIWVSNPMSLDTRWLLSPRPVRVGVYTLWPFLVRDGVTFFNIIPFDMIHELIQNLSFLR